MVRALSLKPDGTGLESQLLQLWLSNLGHVT